MEAKIIELFKKKNGFIHDNLQLKKNDKKGYFFNSKGEIKKKTILIIVPKNLLIEVDKINNLEKFNNQFEKLYFDLITKNKSYLDFHPLNANKVEFNEIIKTLENNQNLSKNFSIAYDQFLKLSNEKKLIKLLALTRSIHFEKIKKNYFMPIMDFVNHNENGPDYMIGNDGSIYIESNKDIKSREEITVNYNNTDSISFFLKHGFVDENSNSFQIKKNELNFQLKNNIEINKKIFSISDNYVKFKENINFKKNDVSANIIDFMSIFPANEKMNNVIKILNYYKQLIKFDNEMVIKNKNSLILKKFYKSVELYIKIIDNYSKILSNKK